MAPKEDDTFNQEARATAPDAPRTSATGPPWRSLAVGLSIGGIVAAVTVAIPLVTQANVPTALAYLTSLALIASGAAAIGLLVSREAVLRRWRASLVDADLSTATHADNPAGTSARAGTGR